MSLDSKKKGKKRNVEMQNPSCKIWYKTTEIKILVFKLSSWLSTEYCFKGCAFVFMKYDSAVDFKPVKI